jgi:hypothetical protein
VRSECIDGMEMCSPNSESVGMAVLGESTGGLSPIQHQVLHKQQAKSEIVQVYTKCSYTHVMAATSYPTSHPRLHPQPQPRLKPTLART